jgi:hypothetical protein
MRRIIGLLIGAGLLVVLGALAGWPVRSATQDEFRFDAAQLKDKALWTQVNKEPYHISTSLDLLCARPTALDYAAERKTNPHAAAYITVYVNNVGREAMFLKELKQFPEGSVIVKEKIGYLEKGPTPLLYTLMTKRRPGYNSAVGDWEFSVVAGNGTEVEASGKLENCQGCHLKKKDSDFIFRPYYGAK